MSSVDSAVKPTDIFGKTIWRLLQTEWENSDIYSHCNFYIEFTDGTLIWLLDDSMSLIGGDSRSSLNLRPVDVDTDFPAFFPTSNGDLGIGARVERVLTMTYGTVWMVVEGQRYLRSVLAEGQTMLELMDETEFLYWPSIFEFFDYWTKEPVIFNNMRAIDVRLTSNTHDLATSQSGELGLTIARHKCSENVNRYGKPNTAVENGWIARFVVSEPGIYRFMVQRKEGEFATDVEIDESVIERGWLEICIQ